MSLRKGDQIDDSQGGIKCMYYYSIVFESSRKSICIVLFQLPTLNDSQFFRNSYQRGLINEAN